MKRLIVHATMAEITMTKIYESMARMYDNDKCPGEHFGENSQLTNWILDYGATCQITPEVSYFIPCSLEDTDKHIKVADRHHVTSKQKDKYE